MESEGDYLLRNDIPKLFNELVADIATQRPDDVVAFTTAWFTRRKAEAAAISLERVTTAPIAGQKTGTSGLRKKTSVFSQAPFLHNWVQALFTALQQTEPHFRGCTLVLGGDGRYWNDEAAQIIIRIAFGNGVGRVVVGQNVLLATPAVSAVIRQLGALGGIIMTASHNPGGPNQDWGIKFNGSGGEPAPERLTDVIFEHTKTITHYLQRKLPKVDLSTVGIQQFDGSHVVQVISSTALYLDTLRGIFDFTQLQRFTRQAEFSFIIDGMHGVRGVGATAFLTEMALGPAKQAKCLQNNVPKPDFGGLHPDPNLTYASHLVDHMFGRDGREPPAFAVAFDGDSDRNMILGREFFVTPSDSVAIIAQYATRAIPYFERNGISGLARSMPTATALDRVAKKLNVPLYEVPTGWKYFCNLMDAGKVSICGEESFGTGSNHIREKDGLWAALAWLSILAYRNSPVQNPTGEFVGVRQIVEDHWLEFGRSFYCRYDFENIDGSGPDEMMKALSEAAKNNGLKGRSFCGHPVTMSDVFEYHDPVDGSVAANQGVRVAFETARIIYRLSGTGSSGSTIRIYVERIQLPPKVDVKAQSQEMCAELAQVALVISRLQHFTGRTQADVVT
eukprot:TRINITY_DN21396_c0_g1_i1.p1 TRINITY_DN21396_c0_g1~~TRINITY_DN21396_c0_g1_i1.p1  ORF type:complete len:627 (+),score=111.24 TRINITY_DN21396_c0_g1_i1:27-1883(+)